MEQHLTPVMDGEPLVHLTRTTQNGEAEWPGSAFLGDCTITAVHIEDVYGVRIQPLARHINVG